MAVKKQLLRTDRMSYQDDLALPQLGERNETRVEAIVNEMREGAPDPVVEIRSPSALCIRGNNRLNDRVHIGMDECWTASAEAQTIQMLQPIKTGRKHQALDGLGDKWMSALLPSFSLKVDDVFAKRA